MISMANAAADYGLDFVYEPVDNGAPLRIHLRDVDGDNNLRLTFEAGLARVSQTYENTYSSLAVDYSVDSDVNTKYEVTKSGTVPSERVFERDGTVPDFVRACHRGISGGISGTDYDLR